MKTQVGLKVCLDLPGSYWQGLKIFLSARSKDHDWSSSRNNSLRAAREDGGSHCLVTDADCRLTQSDQPKHRQHLLPTTLQGICSFMDVWAHSHKWGGLFCETGSPFYRRTQIVPAFPQFCEKGQEADFL